jgi:protein gp37
MGENTAIEWATHTFNPWIGCQKVGPGCDHCYAEAMMADRYGRVEWGPHGSRQRTSPANWKKPLAWDRAAAKDGRRDRVFCASLADVFDNHPSVLPEWRTDLFNLIAKTPNLDWLLLTKRPGNIADMMPGGGAEAWPNVWLGCTVVNQAEADRDIPKLLAVPAKVRFLSMEPLLGPVDLTRCGLNPKPTREGEWQEWEPRADWIICGGESGPKARPMHPDWARSLRDQCQAAGVPFFFKQWGEWSPGDAFGLISDGPVTSAKGSVRDWLNRYVVCEDRGDRLRGYSFTDHATDLVYRVGKARAGRLLDGREWNEVPHA